MKKEGFTLVELLAVIAILAILIIIALPNILEMFNKAKKDSFVTEVRSAYRTAQQRYIADGGVATCYSYPSGEGCYDLEMSGRTDFFYIVEFNSDGFIIRMGATDENFGFMYADDDGISIEDIDSEDVTGSLFGGE